MIGLAWIQSNSIIPQRYQLVEDKLINVTYSVGYIAWSPDDTMICVCGVEKCPEAVVWTVTVSLAYRS